MTGNQLQYMKLQIEKQNLGETQKHNRNTEYISQVGNTINARNAQTNERNAQINWYNAQTKRNADYANVEVNRQNADTNRWNAAINAQNATTNARNADINARNADINQQRANTDWYNAQTKRTDMIWGNTNDSVEAATKVSKEVRGWVQPGNYVFGTK